MAVSGREATSEDDRMLRGYDISESKPLGEGTYGTVYKAKQKATGRIVALKKMPLELDEEGMPSTYLREISLLKHIKHGNVVELIEILHSSSKIVLVFEFIECDLRKFMKCCGNRLSKRQINNLSQQLCHGINYMHAHSVIHRDLKPQNLLITRESQLKLADFGLARLCQSGKVRRYTQEVVTVWYRAPELLLGSGGHANPAAAEEWKDKHRSCAYSTPVDQWSIGCIIAEMVLGGPLFHGDSEIDTILRIFRLLGTPSEETMPGLDQCMHFKVTFPKWRAQSWSASCPRAMELLGQQGVDMVASLLMYNPWMRLRAQQAVNHPYFSSAGRQLLRLDTPEPKVKETSAETPEKLPAAHLPPPTRADVKQGHDVSASHQLMATSEQPLRQSVEQKEEQQHQPGRTLKRQRTCEGVPESSTTAVTC